MSPFPLPLTPLEFYFWSDDRPHYPVSFPIELTFSGKLRPTAWRDALQAAVKRHPLLNAVIDGATDWPCWVQSDGRPIYLDWAVDNEPVTHPNGEYIDLTGDVGLRVWVREGQERTRVYFQFHHACVDGIAAQEFVEDVLVAYCQSIGAGYEHTRLRRLDARQLRRRFQCGSRNQRGTASAWDRVRKGLDLVREWHKVFNRRPALLANGRRSPHATRKAGTPVAVLPATGDSRRGILDFSTAILDGGQVRRLRRVAAAEGVSANDLLIRDMFRALQQWNSKQGNRGNEWLSIGVPTNERRLEDRATPAANQLGFAFLSRRAHDCPRKVPLLKSIHRETESIRRRRLGRCFLRGLQIGAAFRGLIPWFLQRPRSFATICLSNMGRVFARTPLPKHQKRLVCGEAILERISGVPFVRPFTRAAVTVIAYANEMTINLRSDPHFISDVQRQDFLRLYISLLESTLSGSPAAPGKRRRAVSWPGRVAHLPDARFPVGLGSARMSHPI